VPVGFYFCFYTSQCPNLVLVSKVWERAETANDIDKPVFIKKWSNCGDKLVFKLNAQLIEGARVADNLDDNCIKVLQVVNRNSSEIVLKYNTGKSLSLYLLGTADLAEE